MSLWLVDMILQTKMIYTFGGNHLKSIQILIKSLEIGGFLLIRMQAKIGWDCLNQNLIIGLRKLMTECNKASHECQQAD
ncbi:MAG: hypothetical protein CMI06_09840 [Oceanospirillaceae bacterium]|nr:hypothetical protein [Oceanospirillaceae bacterium]